MKLTVTADRYQYILMSGSTTLGHYTSVLDLLKGARQALRKSRTKADTDLRALIENGIAHEQKTLEQLQKLALEAVKSVPA